MQDTLPGTKPLMVFLAVLFVVMVILACPNGV